VALGVSNVEPRSARIRKEIKDKVLLAVAPKIRLTGVCRAKRPLLVPESLPFGLDGRKIVVELAHPLSLHPVRSNRGGNSRLRPTAHKRAALPAILHVG